MLFIVEGCDKSGKTTLSKKLVAQFNAEYIKFSQPKKPPYEEYKDFIKSVDPNKNYVLDRYAYGELVYGPIYRGKSGLTEAQLHYLELLLLPYYPIVVYCRTNVKQVKANFIKDKEEFTRLSDINKIHTAFDRVFSNTVTPVYKYDYIKDLDHAKVLDALGLARMMEHNSAALSHIATKSYLGSSSPYVLFVGDNKNPKRKHLGIFESASGYFLLDVVHKIVDLGFTAFVNSVDCGRVVSKKLLLGVNPFKIVALGKLAAMRLRALDVSFVKVVHPQFAKRFYGCKAKQKYEAEIRKVLK